jgi:hypothetical protein
MAAMAEREFFKCNTRSDVVLIGPTASFSPGCANRFSIGISVVAKAARAVPRWVRVAPGSLTGLHPRERTDTALRAMNVLVLALREDDAAATLGQRCGPGVRPGVRDLTTLQA